MCFFSVDGKFFPVNSPFDRNWRVEVLLGRDGAAYPLSLTTIGRR
jgi:hypothetical protein